VRVEEILPTHSLKKVSNRVGKIIEEIKQLNQDILDLGSGAISLKSDVEKLFRAAEETRDMVDALEETEEKRQKLLQQRGKRSVSGSSGCVVVKYVSCGKCKSACAHGPYAYLVTKVGGKQHWKYVGKRGVGD
jgi:hypothetical protein